MAESSNFIPLGIPKGQLPFDRPNRVVLPERRIGETPGERKQIARDIRKAFKREKKLVKADAKRARKQNAILHRRMTKNPEKYIKNKDRNRERALAAERHKIRVAAVHQAERLAAKHDPSGKSFNVGEVVVLEDGSVKSKEAIAHAAIRKVEREAEKIQKQAEQAAKEAGKQAAKAAKRAAASAAASGAASGTVGLNPERAHLVTIPVDDKPRGGPHISKNQLKRQAALAPKEPPPRPVIPEGISLPEGEEDLIALWDITDEEISKRMAGEKHAKAKERKALRRRQKEQKTINRAMKELKKQTENRGESWDRVKGLELVMMQQQKKSEQETQDSNSSEEEDSEAGEDEENPKEAILQEQQSEPVPESAPIEKVSKKSKKFKKASELTTNGEAAAAEPQVTGNKSKRPAEEELVEEPKAKKSKKSKQPTSEVAVEETEAPVEEPKARKSKKSQLSKTEVAEEVEAPHPAKSEPQPATAEKKRKTKKDKAVAEPAIEVEPTETAAPVELSKAERKAAKAEKKRPKEEALAATNGSADVGETEAPKTEKSYKKKSKTIEASSAEQWNPEALTGDAARQEKFLRLLGAGKTDSKAEGKKHKSGSKSKVEDINKVQSELERQYDAGMKMKHDGGAKRRGLGA